MQSFWRPPWWGRSRSRRRDSEGITPHRSSGGPAASWTRYGCFVSGSISASSCAPRRLAPPRWCGCAPTRCWCRRGAGQGFSRLHWLTMRDHGLSSEEMTTQPARREMTHPRWGRIHQRGRSAAQTAPSRLRPNGSAPPGDDATRTTVTWHDLPPASPSGGVGRTRGRANRPRSDRARGMGRARGHRARRRPPRQRGHGHRAPSWDR